MKTNLELLEEEITKLFAKDIDKVEETKEEDRIYNLLNQANVEGYNMAITDVLRIIKSVYLK